MAAEYLTGFLELFPIIVGVSLWGDKLTDRKVVFWSDNQTVVVVINKQSSSCVHIMTLIRSLVVVCLKWNIWFRAKYAGMKIRVKEKH